MVSLFWHMHMAVQVLLNLQRITVKLLSLKKCRASFASDNPASDKYCSFVGNTKICCELFLDYKGIQFYLKQKRIVLFGMLDYSSLKNICHFGNILRVQFICGQKHWKMNEKDCYCICCFHYWSNCFRLLNGTTYPSPPFDNTQYLFMVYYWWWLVYL